MRDRVADVVFSWNNAQCAFICDMFPDFGAALSLVGNDGGRRFVPVQKGIHHMAVMDITA